MNGLAAPPATTPGHLAADPGASEWDDPRSGDRIDWAVAVRMAAGIAIATWLSTHMLINPPGPHWAWPLLVYLGLRLAGDLVSSLTRRSVAAHLGALMQAASWGYLPLGIHWALGGPSLPALEPWLVGLMILVGGLALAAHFERDRKEHPRSAAWVGLTGLLLAAPGLALATTALRLTAPWNLVLPIVTGTAALVLAILMRPRTDLQETDRTDWNSWMRAHRFRFALIGLVIVTYLLVRHTLAGTVLFLPLWEFVAAVALAGFLLWSLRTHLKQALLDTPVSSPYERHQTTVERQSEGDLDDWETAFGEFLHQGDPARLNQLVVRLEREDQVPARRAFAPVLTHRPPRNLFLLRPAWGYMAAALTLIVLVAALRSLGGHLSDTIPNAALVIPLSALFVGLWAMQFNRHGGPWWIKTLIAYASLGVLPLIELATTGTEIPGPLTLMATLPGAPVAVLLVLQPLTHAWLSRRQRTPRYAYHGDNPRGAMDELTRSTERTLLVRTAWAAGGGLLVFLAVAELSRLAPGIAVVFPLYLITALLLLVHPLVTAIGLRIDHRRVTRSSDQETAARRQYVKTALLRLKKIYDAPAKPGTKKPATGPSDP